MIDFLFKILVWICAAVIIVFAVLLWVATLAFIVEVFKTIIDIFRGKSSGCCSSPSWFEEYRRRNGL
jgi:hypothetical protein